MSLPILDQIPTTKPHDWSYSRIMMAKVPEVLVYPLSYKNPYAKMVAQRDQKDRGTCVGQSTAYCYDLQYIALTKDEPTTQDKEKFKKDVVDSIGTLHDILYPQSASAECFYQISRKIGNVTYPSGSEIRFSARAWINYGMVLEDNWHTDKTGHCVWMYPPGTRVTPDGGISPEDAAAFASIHKAEGYAQVGTPGGNCTWDEVCSAISKKGWVLGAIPIYENYSGMAGGNGAFPDPRGELAGFHALCFYGYDADNLYLIHSWGNWCGMYGSISKNFFNHSIDLIQFFVILDANEVLIARGTYKNSLITSNVPAWVSVSGIKVGNTPYKLPVESGKTYQITVGQDGYYSSSGWVDESITEINFTLEPIPVKKSWLETLIEQISNWIKGVFKW